MPYGSLSVGQIKGVIYKGQVYDPDKNNSLNQPVEEAFDWLTGQAGLNGVQLAGLKTGFGINKEQLKLKARAKVDLPDDRAKVKVDLVIDGVAEINKSGYVKEFLADEARGSVSIGLKKAGGQEGFPIEIETVAPIRLVKDFLGGNIQAVFSKIDAANSQFGPFL